MADETKKPEGESTVATVLQAADRVAMSRAEWALAKIEKHGVPTVALVAVFIFFGLPIRDAHIDYLKKSTDNTITTAEAVKGIDKSTNAIQSAVETLKEQSGVAADIDAEHFELTRQIGANVEAIGHDVGEIKAAVSPQRPRATATRPGFGTAAGS